MELVRSDSPEVARNIASAAAWASRSWPTLGFACGVTGLALLIALTVDFSVSGQVGAWIGGVVFFTLNGYVVWRARDARRRWIVVGSADRLYVRLFASRSGNHGNDHDPDVVVLGASEIASLAIKAVAVYLYGPKPKLIKWLVIEPAQTISDEVSRHVRPLLVPTEGDKAVLVAHEEGCLRIEWRWWRPALPVFFEQVARECPSVTIGREQRSDVDLNGIWNGVRWAWRKPDAQQRQLLAQAVRLGFGCQCAQLLSRHRDVSQQEAAAYLAECAQEQGGDRAACCSR